MTTYYKATFPSGRIETRSTESRAYVACVVAGGYVTWCGNLDRARSEAATQQAKGRVVESAETVIITGAEYRQLKAEARAPKFRSHCVDPTFGGCR